MKRSIATALSVVALACPASAKATNVQKVHRRVEARQQQLDVWRAKLYYWRAQRRHARMWDLSRHRKYYAYKMVRSRKWHAVRAVEAKRWWAAKLPKPVFKPHVQMHYQAASGSLPSPPNIVALGHALQALGFMVSENPAFGGVSPVHAHYGSCDHYHGGAIDVNGGADEATRFDALAPRLKALGWTVLWRVAGHFDHLHANRPC